MSDVEIITSLVSEVSTVGVVLYIWYADRRAAEKREADQDSRYDKLLSWLIDKWKSE